MRALDAAWISARPLLEEERPAEGDLYRTRDGAAGVHRVTSGHVFLSLERPVGWWLSADSGIAEFRRPT